jgi:hypothetical protein
MNKTVIIAGLAFGVAAALAFWAQSSGSQDIAAVSDPMEVSAIAKRRVSSPPYWVSHGNAHLENLPVDSVVDHSLIYPVVRD